MHQPRGPTQGRRPRPLVHAFMFDAVIDHAGAAAAQGTSAPLRRAAVASFNCDAAVSYLLRALATATDDHHVTATTITTTHQTIDTHTPHKQTSPFPLSSLGKSF